MSSGVACVMFTDLVGSTELMARLGDADFDSLRAEHFAGLRQALADAGGTVVKTTGDGLLATFASAVDALSAAVAAQQATDRHGRRAEVPLSIRVGMALGEVVWEDDDVFGTPLVEAARLVDAARPGQILCTALVRAVAGTRAPAPVADAGVLDLKGLPDPVAVCEVAWEPPAEAAALPLPPLLAGAGRIFVGRDAEFDRARRTWKEVTSDDGRRLVLLAGEPGIGKTRLATELARSAHDEGAVVLAGRCDEDLGVPYQPFVEALRHYVAHAVTPRLGRYGGELSRLVPEVRERVPGLPEPLRSDPETERYRLFDAVAAWLADASAESPVLLVLDDVHWAAKPTVLLLRHVLRTAEPLRLMIVVTYRDTDIARGDPLTEFLADLRREGLGDRVSLVGLDRAGVGAFIEAAAGHSLPDEDGDDLISAVWEETEGNPFFVAEVMRHLAESGGIEQRNGRWVMTAPVEQLGIPEGVRDVVGRRLSRLPAGADRLLAIAAVAGLEFEPAIVAAASGCSDDELFSALEAAAAARLVSEVPGGTRYRFSHALVRATLYDEISAPRRVSVHRKVAEALERLHGQHLDDYLPALAHHWARASTPAADPDRAIDYATRAGDRALAQLAHDEAAGYYRQALELLSAAGIDVDARRQELLISLGEAERRAGDPAHRDTLLAAARLAQERGDADALARAALANTRAVLPTQVGAVDQEKVAVLESALQAAGAERTRTRALLLATLALEVMFLDSERALRLSDEARNIASELDEAETLARVMLARFLPTSVPGMLEVRLAETAALMESISSIGDPALSTDVYMVRGRATMEAGEMEESHRCFDTAHALAAKLGQPALSWRTRYLTDVARAIVAGRIREAEQVAVEVRDIGLAAGQPDAEWVFVMQLAGIRARGGVFDEDVEQQVLGSLAWSGLSFSAPMVGLAHWHAGRMDKALSTLGTALSGVLPVDLYWLMGKILAAEVAGLLGAGQEAARLYDDLEPYAATVVPFPPLPTPCVEHWLGVLAATLARHEAAAGHFAAAAAIHERIGAPGFLAETRLGWASSLLRRNGPGDIAHARRLLEQAGVAAAELELVGLQSQIGALRQEGGA